MSSWYPSFSKPYLALALLCLGPYLQAQNPKLEAGQTLYEQGEYEKAIPLLKEALTNSKDEARAKNFELLGMSLLRSEQEQACIDLLSPELKNKKSDPAWAMAYKALGQAHYALLDFPKATAALKTTLELHLAAKVDDDLLGRDYINLIAVLDAQRLHSEQIPYLEAAKKLKDLSEVVRGSLLLSQANFYANQEDFDRSLDYYNQAELYLDAANMHHKLAECRTEKGTILFYKKDYNNSIKSLRNAYLTFASLDDSYNRDIAGLNIAQVFLRQYKHTQKTAYIDSALHYLPLKNTELSPRHQDLARCQKCLALAYQNASNATQDCAQALENQLKLNEGSTDLSSDFFVTYIQAEKIGNNHEKALQLAQQALQYYTQSKAGLLDKLPIDGLKKNQDLAKILDLFVLKADLLLHLYPKDAKYLEQALENILLFDQLADINRKRYGTNKSSDADLNKDAYEKGISICFALHQLQAKETYLEQAFYFAEKSKGLSLLENFQTSKAAHLAQIPQEFLQREQDLKIKCTELEQEGFALRQVPKRKRDQTALAANEKALFEAQRNMEEFQKELEQQYPQYYKIKYEIPILNLGQVRQLLKPEQALVEYFVGDKNLYAFKIDQGTINCSRKEINMQYNERIAKLRSQIYGFYLENSDYANNQAYGQYAQAYAQQAHQFYQELLLDLEPLPRRLLIVTDEALGHLPFETLLKSPAKEPRRFLEHDYLIKHHAISYAFSATLHREMLERQNKPQYGFLGIAPSFGTDAASEIRGKRFALAPLQFNKTEIQGIQNLLGGGKTLLDNEATEDNFKAIASQYRILHFATHGMANDQDPDFSLLAFTEVKDSLENEFLYVSDLYDMQLQADLVVLSACETGIGTIQRGEGIASLARGFSYAGAKSIFTTLWSVNDQAAYQIVEGFYRYMKQGMDKDLALQQAKLDFLLGGDDRTASPFFWAPFILIGDVQNIPLNEGPNYLLYGLGAAAALGLGLLAWRFKQQKRLKNEQV